MTNYLKLQIMDAKEFLKSKGMDNVGLLVIDNSPYKGKDGTAKLMQEYAEQYHRESLKEEMKPLKDPNTFLPVWLIEELTFKQWKKVTEVMEEYAIQSREMPSDEIKLGMFVYHKDLYWGRERMKVIGIRENEIELEGDYSGGTHAVYQSNWMSREGILFKQHLTESKQGEEEVVFAQLSSCDNFEADSNSSSATKCKHCGLEKWQHEESKAEKGGEK